MSLTKIILVLFIISSIQSCQSNFKTPHISDRIIPLGFDGGKDLFTQNVPIDSLRKIKRIEKLEDGTTLNILEFDEAGRLVFNYRKHYMGEYWNGKYVTYITGNVYENALLKKTYHLYSNVGFNIIKYLKYNSAGEPISAEIIEHKGTEPDNNPSDSTVIVGKGLINSNVYRYIDTIESFGELMKFPKLLEMEKLNNITYTIKRKSKYFSNKVIDKYDYSDPSSEDFIVDFTFDKNGNLVQRQNEYWKYDNYGRITENFYVFQDADTSEKHIYKYKDNDTPDLITVGENKYIQHYKNGLLYLEEEYNGSLFIRSTEYNYNSLGLIIEEKHQEDDKTLIKKFNYKIEYY